MLRPRFALLPPARRRTASGVTAVLDFTGRNVIRTALLAAALASLPIAARAATRDSSEPHWRAWLPTLRAATPAAADSIAGLIVTGAERRAGRDGPDGATVLDSLIGGLPAAVRPAIARVLSMRLLATAERPGGWPPGRLALAHARHAWLCDQVGDRQAQAVHAERAVALAEGSADLTPANRARLLEELAFARRSASRLDEARELLTRALDLRRAEFGDSSVAVALTYRHLASLERSAGRLAEARRAMDRSLARIERLERPDSLSLLDIYNMDAILLSETSRTGEAFARFAQCATIRRAVSPPNDREVALFLNNAGLALARLRRHREALCYHDTALAIRTRIPDRPGIRESNQSIASSLLALGELTEAESRMRLVISMAESGRAAPLVLAEALGLLASVHERQGRFAEADSEYAVVLRIREANRPVIHPTYSATAAARAWTLACAGDGERALAWALLSDSLSREHLLLASRGMAETQLLGVIRARPLNLDLALSLAVESPQPHARRRVFDAVVRDRALVLDELALRHRDLVAAREPAIGALRDSLAAIQRALARMVSRSGPDSLGQAAAQLRAMQSRRERTEGELAELSSDFRSRRIRRRAGLAEISEALPPGSVLLAYVHYLGRHYTPRPGSRPSALSAGADSVPSYAVFVLRAGDEDPRLVPLGRAPEVEALIAEWRAQIASPKRSPLDRRRREQSLERAGGALCAAIWDPVAELVRDAARVFVVPAGAVSQVSFGALNPGGGSRFLVETAPVLHLLSAERDLVGPPDDTTGAGLLCLAAPDYGPPPAPAPHARPCGDFAGLVFSPIPAAGLEGAEIAALWDSLLASHPPQGPRTPSQLLAGELAAESALRERARGQRIVHLATHGFFREPCEDSLGADVHDLDPLVRSGLALAGANLGAASPAGQEDGLLLASEVSSLDLRGVEWVVLSACDTGLGVMHRGEGVLGLRRAFAIAGARTSIMSLWPVADTAARAWMRRLYHARLVEGRSTADACRQASLGYLASARATGASTHPASWAAFVAMGDWR